MLANCVMLAVVLSLDQSSLPGRWLPADACDESRVSHREFFFLHLALHALHVVTLIVREFMIPCHLEIAKNRYPNCIRLDLESGGFRIKCSPRQNVKFDF